MWKKHGSALLGLILTVALFITGIRLPDYVLAAENDKTSIVKDAKLIISQKEGYNDYKPVTGDISTDKDIQVDISFTAVFNKTLNEGNYIKKGDYVQFDLGEKLKFTGDNSAANEVIIPINDKSLNVKICDAIFTKDASGNIKVKFDFSNSDDKVFDKASADIGASIKVDVDLSKFDYENTTEKVIKIFGKEYKVGVIDSDVELTKTGVIDVKNSKIDWTITAQRFVKGVEPRQPLSIEGYTFLEDPTSQGEWGNNYIPGTFTINDKSRDETSGLKVGKVYGTDYTDAMSYTIKAEDLDTADTSKAVVKFSTDVNFGGEFDGGDRYYYNAVELVKFNTSQRWRVSTGVSARKMGQKTGTYDANTKTITWAIDFNYPKYELGDVTISDELTKDNQGRIPQKFKKAYIQDYDYTKYDFSSVKTEITPVISGDNHTFTIPNVTGRFKLIIETEIEPDNYRIDFSNDAYVWWNNNVKNKTKLHADIYTVPGGDIKFGEINKTAKSQAWNDGELGYVGGKGDYIGFEPEWTVTANKDAVSTPGDYYMYDAFIFDNSVSVDRETINADNGFSIRKVGDNNVTTLANGVSFDKVFSNKSKNAIYKRHQKLVNPESPVTDATSGLTNSVYEVLKGGVVVGHILELKLVQGADNYAKFKSRVMDKDLVVLDRDDGVYQVQNYLALTKGAHVVLDKLVGYHYQPKLLDKHVLSKTVAKQFLTDYNAEATNSNVYDAVNNRAIDNRDTAYDRDTRSVVFRISVNAKDIKDVNGDLGKFILDDKLCYKLKLVPIKDNKYFLIYKGEPTLKYNNTNEADQRYGSVPTFSNDITGKIGSLVNAVGNPLSDQEIADKGIGATIGKDGYNDDLITFSFDKIDSPYVIFVKAVMKNDLPLNEKGEVWNNATIMLEGGNTAITKNAYAKYDERFLWKNHDADKVFIDDHGYINWNVYYKPYRVYAANDTATVRLEDELNRYLVLRKEKGTDKLIFADDNYKVWKGEYDDAGNFVNAVEITTGLDEIFKYDLAKKKLVMHIPDRNAGYRFSYITDFAKDVAKDVSLENSVALIEKDKQVGSEVRVSHKVEANAWGSLKDMNYGAFQLVKTDTEGTELAGAEFNLKKLASAQSPAGDMGTVISATNSAVKFANLTVGEYELTETKSPVGYESNGVVYKIKVVELENGGLKVLLDGNYEGKAKMNQGVLSVINKKTPDVPNPVNPPTPVNPTPVVPPTPVNPTPVVPPTPDNPTPLVPVTPTPDNPTPVIPITPTPTPTTPITPTTPSTITPTPNSPKTPDGVVVDEDKTPQGKVVKTNKPKGKNNQIVDDDDTPLGGNKAKKNLPKTGGTSTVWYYVAGIGLVLVGGLVLIRRKKEK